jgi:hypothetical protein
LNERCTADGSCEARTSSSCSTSNTPLSSSGEFCETRTDCCEQQICNSDDVDDDSYGPQAGWCQACELGLNSCMSSDNCCEKERCNTFLSESADDIKGARRRLTTRTGTCESRAENCETGLNCAADNNICCDSESCDTSLPTHICVPKVVLPDCDRGYYRESALDVDCKACEIYQFQDQKTQVETCKDCPAGKTTRSKGQSSCVSCDAGTFNAISATMTGCRNCPAGYYAQGQGSTACTSCPAGNYSSDGASACQPCTKGSYSSGQNSISCQRCEVGLFQPQDGQSECKKCDAGKTTPGPESTTW